MKRKPYPKGTNPNQGLNDGIHGKQPKRFADGSNVVVIEPDVSEFFPDGAAVNEALRSLVTIIKRQRDVESGIPNRRPAQSSIR